MNKLKIVCISDTHGYLPEIPPCDLLIIAGDICPAYDHSIFSQRAWLGTNFKTWLENLPAEKIVGIAGNHDFIFQKVHNVSDELELPWTYLENSDCIIDGIGKIWGSPWTKYFCNWAFNAPENSSEKYLSNIWHHIPDDTDIVITHGPPYGIGDLVSRGHQGSLSLYKRVKEIKPKLHVFGHIHEGRGCTKEEATIFANVSMVDGNYERVYAPFIC